MMTFRRLAGSVVLLLTGPVMAQTAQTANRAWQHEPAKWSESEGVLTETVSAGTDYWRVTHYGFIRDNGPFRYQEKSGDFEAEVRVSGRYRELYHQAGLMIRLDEKNWI